MARFQIKLLTPQINTTTQGVCFLETPMSEFYDQQEIYQNTNVMNRQFTYCYTYQEKFSVHDNGQKELTFSMMRNIWLDNELTQNPFVSRVKIGSQLILIDKYDNEYFFTVTDIKYTVKNSNIIYDYVCQDSFTYQHIRQNDGYEIENNAESSDFIGSKTIDWWAKKIKDECHISYEYIPLSYGLYLSQNDSLKIFGPSETPTDVKKIIKPPFLIDNKLTTRYNAYPEYHEKIPFSISGSNASSALISLGDELGLALNYREHNIRTGTARSNRFIRYFWYEPKKNEKTSNIKYSPSINIQSFNFSHEGSSLTTVLNVDSTSVGEELITMIPSIPPFFSQLFSSAEWENTNYEDGYFTQICQQQTYYSENGHPGNSEFTVDVAFGVADVNTSWVDSDNGHIYLSIYNEVAYDKETQKYIRKLRIPPYYNKIRLFNALNNQTTSMFIDRGYYSSKTSFIEFGVLVKKDDGFSFTPYNNSFSLLPDSVLGNSLEGCFLRISCNWVSEIPSLKDVKVCLSFYRDATSDELDFASMADRCPWLENKLIDFSYFLDQKLISSAEYKNLIDTITNDLRIVNGKLLYYSKGYYDAIRKKTTEVAELLSSIDSIGAAFNSDIVEQYKTKGSIPTTAYFRKAYNTFLTKYTTATQATSILNYNNLLTEYFNKFFDAQQRFLKNMFYFKQYFNQKINWGGNEIIRLAKKTLTFSSISDTSNIRRYLSFNKQPVYRLINESFNKYDNNYTPLTKIYFDDKITEVEVVDKINYKQYYISTIQPNDMLACDKDESFDESIIYFRRLYKTPLKNKEILKDSFTINETSYVKHSQDLNFIWYGPAVPDSSITTEWPESLQYTDNITLSIDYVRVFKKDLINEWLYNFLYLNRNQVLHQHSANTDTEVSSWIDVDQAENNFFDIFTPRIFKKILSDEDYDSSTYTALVKAIESDTLIDKVFADQPEAKADAIKYYKAHFPITSVSYKGQNYKSIPYQVPGYNGAITLDFQPANKSGDTLMQYLSFLEAKELNGENPNKKVRNPFNTDEKTIFSIPVVNLTNEQEFFRRVPGSAATAAAWTIGAVGFVAGAALSWFATPVVGAALTGLTSSIAVNAYLKGDTEWKTSGSNTKYWNDVAFGSIYTGYHDKDEIIYAPTSSSYDEYLALKLQAGVGGANIVKELQDIKVIGVEDSLDGYEVFKTGKNKKIVYSTKDWAEHEYYNYYSKLGFTYSSAKKSNLKLYYKDAFFRPVLIDDLIDPVGPYKLLNYENLGLNNKESKTWNEIFGSREISRIKYYFIDKNSISLDTCDIKDTTTWGEFFKNQFQQNNVEVEITQDDFYTITVINKTTQESNAFIIFKEEDFKRENINILSHWDKGTLKASKRYSLYQGKDIFTPEGDKLSFLSQKGLVSGFYRHAQEHAGFIACDTVDTIYWEDVVDDQDQLTSSTKFFKNNDGTYLEIPTIYQIKQEKKYFYLQNEEYTIDTLSNIYDFGKIKIYYHQETYNDQGELILDKDKTFIKEGYVNFNYEINGTTTDTIIASFVDESDNEFKRECKLSSVEGEQVNNATNGQFWYLYHNRTDCPLLFEQAAVIESELTLYWSQAYTASLGCEYFLPPSWQLRTDGSTNYFNYQIIKVGSDNKVFLSNWYIPDVEIYQENGKTLVQKYDIEYGGQIINEQSLARGSEIIYPNNKTSINHEISSQHPIILSLNEIGESASNFIIDKGSGTSRLNKTTYFYNKNSTSGIRWKDFIQKHSGESFIYDQYSGNYIMMYKILKERFTDRQMHNYESSKEQQQLIWQKLYENYPGILLESSYNNSSAISSEDLYNLAVAAFKDKQYPERNYNISLIDIYNNLQVKTQDTKTEWTKYYGQELKVGDGILVDVNEYYETPDDVYKTISQYLFITDISYELRKDSNINITINTIKYQDKLIKRLVKLIK